MYNKFTNIKRFLAKFAKMYNAVLKSTADVRTGALKRSIDTRVDGFSVITSMLGYGEKKTSWSNEKTPIIQMQSLYKDISKELSKAFAQDLRVSIRQTNKKLK